MAFCHILLKYALGISLAGERLHTIGSLDLVYVNLCTVETAFEQPIFLI